MNQAAVSLMEHLVVLEDPRKRSNGTRHEFVEILVIAICATAVTTCAHPGRCSHNYQLGAIRTARNSFRLDSADI
jgi:hypothetical protein